MAATDPLYILYTSGTTGMPKGVVRDNGGHAVALEWSMEHVYGVAPGEVFWAASDIGWVVGPFLHRVRAAAARLHHGACYEGKPVGTPDRGRVSGGSSSSTACRSLFTAPTAFRAIKQEDPDGEFFRKHDLSGLRTLFLAGERLDPDTYHWARGLLRRPVIDHWWQTETGWPVAANCMGLEPLPVKPGSPTKPVPGYVVEILDDEGKPVPPNRDGRGGNPAAAATGHTADPVAGRRAIPRHLSHAVPRLLSDRRRRLHRRGRVSLHHGPDRRRHHRGGPQSLDRKHRAGACQPSRRRRVCGIRGRRIHSRPSCRSGWWCSRPACAADRAVIVEELIQIVREQVGPVASLKQVSVVSRLPKTRSGKVLRGTMRQIADGEPYRVPPTIDDPATLDEVRLALERLGYARQSPAVIGG